MKIFKNLFRVTEIDYLDRTISDLRETIAGYEQHCRAMAEQNKALGCRNAVLVATVERLTRQLAAASRDGGSNDAPH